MHKYIIQKHVILGYSKYDYSRYVPDSVIIQVINSICGTNLLKDLEIILNYSFHIKNSIEEGLSILIDIIFNLYLIIRK